MELQIDINFSYLGLYSQKVFRNLNWTNIKSVAYADFKNENGEEYLTDTREHTHIMTYFRKIM